MNVQLALTNPDAEELRGLHEWLLLEPELRGRIKVGSLLPKPREMGALGDALVVAAGSGGALSVLFASLKAWFAQPKRSDVCIELHTADGRRIIVTAACVSRPDKLIREVLDDGGAE